MAAGVTAVCTSFCGRHGRMDCDRGAAVGFTDVAAAADRLRGVAMLTPLLESEALNALVGGRLLIKAEPLQRTGSFKFRGAYNAISVLRPRAVVAYSSGNHAQGVALAARLLGIPATIVMPADAPRTKLEGTRALGAEVVTYDRAHDDREAIGREIAERDGAVLIRPYDDPLIIAGQGTVGLELAEQAARRRRVAGCGAGLLRRRWSGRRLRHRADPPRSRRRGPRGRARRLRRHLPLAGRRPTSCATLPTAARSATRCWPRCPGELTFAVNSRLLASGLVVTEAEVAAAMRLAFRHLRAGGRARRRRRPGRGPGRQAADPGSHDRSRPLGRQRRRWAVRRRPVGIGLAARRAAHHERPARPRQWRHQPIAADMVDARGQRQSVDRWRPRPRPAGSACQNARIAGEADQCLRGTLASPKLAALADSPRMPLPARWSRSGRALPGRTTMARQNGRR